MTLKCGLDLDLTIHVHFEPCISVPAGQNISKFLHRLAKAMAILQIKTILSGLYEFHLRVHYVFRHFAKMCFEAISFELKHIGWWFWCLGLRFVGQAFILMVCLAAHLPIFLAVHLPLSVWLSAHLSICRSVSEKIFSGLYECPL